MSERTAPGAGGEGPPSGGVLPEAGEPTLRSRIGKDLRAIWANGALWDMLFSERFDHPRDWVGRDTVPMFDYHGAKDSLAAIDMALCTGQPRSTSQRIALANGCMAQSDTVWTPYFDCRRRGGRVAGVDALTRIKALTVPFLDMSEGYWSAMQKHADQLNERRRLAAERKRLTRHRLPLVT